MYKLKPGDGENPPRDKVHIVVKGFQQKKGVDFDEIFALVVKLTSIQTVLSIATSMDLEVEQMDVKRTFLHGDLEELKKLDWGKRIKIAIGCAEGLAYVTSL